MSDQIPGGLVPTDEKILAELRRISAGVGYIAKHMRHLKSININTGVVGCFFLFVNIVGLAHCNIRET